MKTHWNTVSSNRQSKGAFPLFLSTACCGSSTSTSQFTFPGLGFESPVKAIFCDGTPMTTHIHQSKKLFKKYSPLIDRRTKLGEGKKAKNLPRLGLEPQTWKHGSGTATVCWIVAHARYAVTPRCGGNAGKTPYDAYCFTQCSNGSSLGSFLFPRQDNHVQRCTVSIRSGVWGEIGRKEIRRQGKWETYDHRWWVPRGWRCAFAWQPPHLIQFFRSTCGSLQPETERQDYICMYMHQWTS